jgi:hypothetical protein
VLCLDAARSAACARRLSLLLQAGENFLHIASLASKARNSIDRTATPAARRPRSHAQRRQYPASALKMDPSRKSSVRCDITIPKIASFVMHTRLERLGREKCDETYWMRTHYNQRENLLQIRCRLHKKRNAT